MIKKKSTKQTSFQYKILALILIILASGLVLLPKYEKQEGIKSELLLNKAISKARYISTDEIAHKIVSEDPSFILIDLRDKKKYNDYSITNAINIPFEKLLDDEFANYLNQDQVDIIFYSDDHLYSDQAWLLCNRLGYKNLRVLKGGLNEWYSTIINPTKPTEDMSAREHKLYNTRKASSMFFGVAYPDQTIKNPRNQNSKTPKRVITTKKKKKRVAEGGC